MKIGLAYDSDTKLWSWVAGYRDEGVVTAHGTAKDAIAAVTEALKTPALSQIGLPGGAYEDRRLEGRCTDFSIAIDCNSGKTIDEPRKVEIPTENAADDFASIAKRLKIQADKLLAQGRTAEPAAPVARQPAQPAVRCGWIKNGQIVDFTIGG